MEVNKEESGEHVEGLNDEEWRPNQNTQERVSETNGHAPAKRGRKRRLPVASVAANSDWSEQDENPAYRPPSNSMPLEPPRPPRRPGRPPGSTKARQLELARLAAEQEAQEEADWHTSVDEGGTAAQEELGDYMSAMDQGLTEMDLDGNLTAGDELVRSSSLSVLAMVGSIMQCLSLGPKTESELKRAVRRDLEKCSKSVDMAPMVAESEANGGGESVTNGEEETGDGAFKEEMLCVRLVIDVLQAVGIIRSEVTETSLGGGPDELHPPQEEHGNQAAPCMCSRMMAMASEQLGHRFVAVMPGSADQVRLMAEEALTTRLGLGSLDQDPSSISSHHQDPLQRLQCLDQVLRGETPAFSPHSAAQNGTGGNSFASSNGYPVGSYSEGAQNMSTSTTHVDTVVDQQAPLLAHVANGHVDERTRQELLAQEYASIISQAIPNGKVNGQISAPVPPLPSNGLPAEVQRLAKEGLFDAIRTVWGEEAEKRALEYAFEAAESAPIDDAAFKAAMEGDLQVDEEGAGSVAHKYGRAVHEALLVWLHIKAPEWTAWRENLVKKEEETPKNASPERPQPPGLQDAQPAEVATAGDNNVREVRFRIDPDQDKALLSWGGPMKELRELDQEVARLALVEESILKELLRRLDVEGMPLGVTRTNCVEILRRAPPRETSAAGSMLPPSRPPTPIGETPANNVNAAAAVTIDDRRRSSSNVELPPPVNRDVFGQTAAALIRRAKVAQAKGPVTRIGGGSGSESGTPRGDNEGGSSTSTPAPLRRKMSSSGNVLYPSVHAVPPMGSGIPATLFRRRNSNSGRQMSRGNSMDFGSSKDLLAPDRMERMDSFTSGQSTPSHMRSGPPLAPPRTRLISWSEISESFVVISESSNPVATASQPLGVTESTGGGAVAALERESETARARGIVAPRFWNVVRRGEKAAASDRMHDEECASSSEEDCSDAAYTLRHTASLLAMKESIDASRRARSLLSSPQGKKRKEKSGWLDEVSIPKNGLLSGGSKLNGGGLLSNSHSNGKGRSVDTRFSDPVESRFPTPSPRYKIQPPTVSTTPCSSPAPISMLPRHMPSSVQNQFPPNAVVIGQEGGLLVTTKSGSIMGAAPIDALKDWKYGGINSSSSGGVYDANGGSGLCNGNDKAGCHDSHGESSEGDPMDASGF